MVYVVISQDVRYLWEGFHFGFRIPFQDSWALYMARNFRSISGIAMVVQEKIDKLRQECRVLGPFASPPLPNLRVFSLGIVPKKTPGEYRLIHHLFYPPGELVNNAIPDQLCSVRYTFFEQAVQVVRGCGPWRKWLNVTLSLCSTFYQ